MIFHDLITNTKNNLKYNQSKYGTITFGKITSLQYKIINSYDHTYDQ